MIYEIAYGPHFIDARRRLAGDQPLWRQVHEILGDLAEGRWRPSMQRTRVGRDPNRPLCKVRLNDADRLIYEGPLILDFGGEPKLAIWVHEVGRHDDIEAMIQRALGSSLTSISLEETPWVDDPAQGETPLAERQCWWIPWPALIEFESFESLQDRLASAIKLSPRQLEAIRNPYPLLIQGQAGSGKTVLLCHHMAARLDEDQRLSKERKRLYLTYSERLVERAKLDVEHIMKVIYASDVPPGQTEFLTHENLLRKYVARDTEQFSPLKRISWPEFRSQFLGERSNQKPELVWHAIRSFFKGACQPGVEPPLRLEHFERIPARQRPFDRRQFNDLYLVADQYQRWLRRNGYWDDLDLARAALNTLQADANSWGKIYSEVYCDEGQDLTLVDYEVLIRLCKAHDDNGMMRPGLVVAADPFQTIHPSGFRWSSVKDRIFGVIERTYGTQLSLLLTPLAENFRCTNEIVLLSNALLDLRSRYSDEAIPVQRPTGPDRGRPLLVETRGLDSDLKSVLQRPSAGTAIVVADLDAKAELREQGVPDDKLFTIVEAKGLEFENVIAWHLLDGHDDLWSIITSEVVQISEASRIRLVYYLNNVYVGVTRAIGQLVLLETPTGTHRCIVKLGSMVQKITTADLKRDAALKKESTLQEWRDWAEILFGREDYTRAAAAYERARDPQNVSKCRAHEARVMGQHAKSARYFLASGDSPMALEMFYQAGLWDEVIQLGPQVAQRGARYVARAWYQSCEADGRADESLLYLERTIRDGVESDLGWLRTAAKRYDDLGRYSESAPLWNRVGDYERAGDCFVRVQRWEEAVAAYAKGSSRSSGRHLAEGELAFSFGDNEKAVESFRKAQAWDRMLAAADRGGLQARLEALRRLGRVQDALDEADRQRVKSKGDERTITRLDRERLELLAELQRWTEARKLADDLEDFESALKYALAEGAEPRIISRLKIRMFQKERKWGSAAEVAKEAGWYREAFEYQAKAFEAEARFEEAAGAFISIGFLGSAWEAIQKRGDSPRAQGESRGSEARSESSAKQAALLFMELIGKNEGIRDVSRQTLKDVDRKAVDSAIEVLGFGSQQVFQEWEVQNRTWFLKSLREIADRHALREEDPAALILSQIQPEVLLNAADRRELARELRGLEEAGYLDRLLTPIEVARAWEVSHSFKYAAEAYRAIADSLDQGTERISHLESALRMREAQRDHHKSQNEFNMATALEKAIERLRQEIARDRAEKQ
ncbi:MAG: ATP-dependent helicase [Blastocatellales bacterium]|nr:ATP-dependent helicase [Blastocatellales bacterium]